MSFPFFVFLLASGKFTSFFLLKDRSSKYAKNPCVFFIFPLLLPRTEKESSLQEKDFFQEQKGGKFRVTFEYTPHLVDSDKRCRFYIAFFSNSLFILYGDAKVKLHKLATNKKVKNLELIETKRVFSWNQSVPRNHPPKPQKCCASTRFCLNT